MFFFFLINGKVWTCFFPWRRSYDAVTKQMSHKWNLSLHYKKKILSCTGEKCWSLRNAVDEGARKANITQ